MEYVIVRSTGIPSCGGPADGLRRRICPGHRGRGPHRFCFARRLLESGRAAIGIDNVSHYSDPALKAARLAKLRAPRGFTFHRIDLADRAATWRLP